MSDEVVEAEQETVLEPDTNSLIPSAYASGEVQLADIVEAALMAAGEPLSVEQLCALFADKERPHGREMRKCLQEIAALRDGGAIELKEVASGWRFQVRETFAPWVKRLFAEKPQRYSRALLETLAIIAYRQPVTRGEIEEIRGVAVSTNIMRTLQERDWIRVLGHKELPGRPAMYGTNRGFLDYFNLKSLDELPSLAELKDFDKMNVDLDLSNPDLHLEGEPAANNDTLNIATEPLPLESKGDSQANETLQDDAESHAVDAGLPQTSAPDQVADVGVNTETESAAQTDDDLIVSDGSESIH